MKHSFLRNRVGNILPLGSKKQMIGPDAPTVITFVKNKKARFDWANMNLPRNTVGRKSFLIDMKLSVAFLSYGPIPCPTFVGGGFYDFR